MTFNGNPYYSPERCGLEIFDSIDTAGAYEFRMFVIWKKLDDGSLWFATDSGCSCPTPFEDYHSLEEFTKITLDNFNSFDNSLSNHSGIYQGDYKLMSNKVKKYLKTSV